MDNLTQKHQQILSVWKDYVFSTYASDAKKVFQNEKDRFSNPVGFTINTSLDAIYNGLVKGEDIDNLKPFIIEIMKLRAVQDFTPSQALSFFFELKKILVEENVPISDLSQIFDRIDKLALLAFDAYADALKRLCEIRISEIKRMTSRLLDRAGISLTLEDPSTEKR